MLMFLCNLGRMTRPKFTENIPFKVGAKNQLFCDKLLVSEDAA
jgi:hypothetical protein